MECLVNFTWEAIRSRAFVCWEFFDYYFNFIRCNLSIQVSVFSWFILEDCMFLGIYPIFPSCLVCWHIIICNIFLQSFVFLWCQLLFVLFISDFIYLGPFSFFFLMSLVKILSILFIFSKNQFLESLTFSIVFCTLFCLFLLWSLLFPSFYSLWTLFLVLFLVPLGIRLMVYLRFFLLVEVGLYGCEFPC